MARNVGLALFDQARRELLPRKRLGHDGRECHQLDAETGIDGFDLVAQQPCHALDVAKRQARADANRLRAAVDTVADEIKPRRAPRPLLSKLSQSWAASLPM